MADAATATAAAHTIRAEAHAAAVRMAQAHSAVAVQAAAHAQVAEAAAVTKLFAVFSLQSIKSFAVDEVN